MKISDDELQKWINNIELMGTQTHLLPFLTELQQSREEWSWIPISNLSEESAPQFFQLSDGKTVNPMPFWLQEEVLCTWAEDQDGIGDVSIEMAQEWYTHFRPLPMDLPEGE